MDRVNAAKQLWLEEWGTYEIYEKLLLEPDVVQYINKNHLTYSNLTAPVICLTTLCGS